MTSSRRNIGPEPAAEMRALVLLRTAAVPDRRLIRLLACYNPQSILDNATPALIGSRAFSALESAATHERADRALAMLERLDVHIITFNADEYPEQLRDLAEYAPPILFCRGRRELLESRGVAVIGARDSTEYGDSVAELFASELAKRNVTVISGLARGIDSIAHQSALRAGGATVAVLGCGIDVHYPPSNAQLHERIAEEGLLISEFAPGEPAYPGNFPQRNRLIALLGRAVLVVEAGVKSGTRKTVDWALRYNIDVFAVPGPIGRDESQGTNEIIRDGGHVALSVRDIFEVLNWSGFTVDSVAAAAKGPMNEIDPAMRGVYTQIPTTGMHVDDIARRTGLAVPAALACLMQLELDGWIVQHPGKRFARVLVRK